MIDTYRNIHASLLRFCSDFAGEMTMAGHPMQPVHLDSFINEDDWPKSDFIGVGQVTVEMDETPEVYCVFALSTNQDPNLMRMSRVMNHLSNRLMPNQSLNLLDSETGNPIGLLMVAKGTRVDPPITTRVQPIQPVYVRLLGDQRNF